MARSILSCLSFFCLLGGICLSFSCFSWGQESIWTPLGGGKDQRDGECYFRKKFTLVRPERGEISLAASGDVSVFLNGNRVDLKLDPKTNCHVAQVSRLLKPGVNLIAARVASTSSPHFLSMKLRVKEAGETHWRALPTDNTWLTHRMPEENWYTVGCPDISWVRARCFNLATETDKRMVSTELPIAGADGGLPTSIELIPGRPRRMAPSWGANGSLNRPPRVVDPALVSSESPRELSWVTTIGDIVDDTAGALKQIESSFLSTGEAFADESAAPANFSNQVETPAEEPIPDDAGPTRYHVKSGFVVEKVLDGAETKSILAMAFNEFGLILFSQEGGPLMVADPHQPAGNRVQVACDQIKSCQGILPFNGNIYVTGDGPEGLALYELIYEPTTSRYVVGRNLLSFTGQIGEHGPHGVAIGPDGMIYVVVGSASYVAGPWPANSPLNQAFDTDLLPKREDPGGHAHGVKAPGGTIVRVSLDGRKREIVAGGLRNAYDLAFNSLGDLFVHDADMEADIGLPWYQPTLLYHVPHGADLGWRSGWSRMQTDLPDTIPPLADTGRGSPTGAVCYRHVQFPIQYHDALFLADWSAGRILTVRLKRHGSTYLSETDVFLQAQPLNVTDLDVGEDGALYFCTGGRGTRGGIYRVRWTGEIPPQWLSFADNVARVIRHPQPSAAWTRQNLSMLSQSQGRQWSEKLLAAARDRSFPPANRAQALEAIVFYCGMPDVTQLESLSQDYSEQVRAKVAQLYGFDRRGLPLLERMLDDLSPLVLRHVCESYLRLGETPPVERILAVLARAAKPISTTTATPVSAPREPSSVDRHLQVVARRLLERAPCESYLEQILSAADTELFIQGGLAVVSAHPTPEHCRLVVESCVERLAGSLTDTEALGLLRLVQVALGRYEVDQDLSARLAQRLLARFPSSSARLNRELSVLLVYLQAAAAGPHFAEYLNRSPDGLETKMWVAMQVARGAEWLDDETRLAVIETLHQARLQSTAGTYRLYLQAAIRETAEHVGPEHWMAILKRGADWVDALVPIFYKIKDQTTDEHVRLLIELDHALLGSKDDSAVQARMGIIALLAESNVEAAFEHLRWCWRHEPKRRNELALGLSRKPEGKNWSYLVTSLSELDDLTCAEVIDQLIAVPRRPAGAEHYRVLLETGYRLQGFSAEKVSQLMEHWTQLQPAPRAPDWKSRLDFWREWYQQQWPREAPIQLPMHETLGRYSVQQILQHWASADHRANPERGKQIFVKANCVQCHRVGTVGDSAGPDLTALSARFSRREAVEAIVDPSRVIPDRYRASLVLDHQGTQYVGLLTDNGESYTILQADGRRVRVAKSEIDQIRTVETSVMPARLLDSLTLDEIVDLMSYIMGDPAALAGQESSVTELR